MQKTTTIKEADISFENLVALIEHTIYLFGVPPMLRGYQYIIKAELMLFENSDCINRLRDEVYPKIATQCDTSAERVERAIRHAIEISWSWEGESSLKSKYSNNFVKPTNGEYLEFIQKFICSASENP